MKKFKFQNIKQNDLLKELCTFTELDFKVKSNGYVTVEDKDQYIFDDIQCLIRTLKFPKEKWTTYSLIGDDEFDEKLINYIKQNNIEYLKEFDDEGDVWITVSDESEIPDEIYND
jgi:hypothetical protein